ncbi:MAG: hypothetical protein OXF55_03180 [Caldilineaceae bacterium]|nr:hypothetical protein [Caldilineaceae bacterium]MDE0080040.1 hypothetical protein [Caldilineaceae bacterium]
MNYSTRREVYRQIEEERESKLLTYVTSDRQGMDAIIAHDCIDPFVDLLDGIGPTSRISLVLHTSGGQTLAAWRLINLIRMFCEELEVLIPSKALSAGTLLSIGADKIIMTKQAILGPIDPSVNNPLNPQVDIGGQPKQVPVSVESVLGYLSLTREELEIDGVENLTNVLLNLSTHIHPLVLGEIFRTRAQIRFLAEKLLPRQVKEESNIKSIVDFLCADSGSHDYTIARREASELGLNIEKPSVKLYELLREVHMSYSEELHLLEPFTPQEVLAKGQIGNPIRYSFPRGLVESTTGGCYSFLSEGTMTFLQIPIEGGIPQEGFKDDRTFEAWRKVE